MQDILSILNNFNGKEVLVIGDIMLDTYFHGEVTRISVEAPIPIVKVEQEFHILGGAGNVAANVAALGGRATLFSFVGQDYQSEILKDLLNEKKIEFFLQNDKKTIHKIRIVGNNRQLARADFEHVKENIFSNELKEKLRKKAETAKAIIISDYLKGAINSDLMNFLLPFKKKMIVDPKP